MEMKPPNIPELKIFEAHSKSVLRLQSPSETRLSHLIGFDPVLGPQFNFP